MKSILRGAQVILSNIFIFIGTWYSPPPLQLYVTFYFTSMYMMRDRLSDYVFFFHTISTGLLFSAPYSVPRNNLCGARLRFESHQYSQSSLSQWCRELHTRLGKKGVVLIITTLTLYNSGTNQLYTPTGIIRKTSNTLRRSRKFHLQHYHGILIYLRKRDGVLKVINNNSWVFNAI